MRELVKIAVAVLIMAAVVPAKGQAPTEWKRVNDSTWVRWGENAMGVYAETARQADIELMVADINNDLLKVSHIRCGVLGCGAVAALGSVWAVANQRAKKSTVIPTVIISVSGVAATALGIAEISVLWRDRVYVSPEGVVIRIGESGKRRFIGAGQRR